MPRRNPANRPEAHEPPADPADAADDSDNDAEAADGRAPRNRLRLPTLQPPPSFDGDLTQTRAFVRTMRRYLRIADLTPHHAVTVILGQLTGRAAAWAEYLDDDPEHAHWDNPDAVLSALAVAFHNARAQNDANQQLLRLNNSVHPDAVLSTIREHRYTTSFDEPTLVTLLINALPMEVAFQLVSKNWDERPLDDVLSVSAKLLNVYTSVSGPRAAAHHRLQGAHQQQQPRPRPSPGPAAAPTTTGAAALRASAISPDERDRRRRENLCFYCGQAGHVKSACPNRGGPSSAAAPPAPSSFAPASSLLSGNGTPATHRL